MTSADQPIAFSLHPTDLVYETRCVVNGAAAGSGEVGADWDRGQLVPFADLSISPAAAVLSYGVGVFEGLNVHRTTDDRLLAFRLPSHAQRMQRSAGALLMPAFPIDRFQSAVADLVGANAAHVPATGHGALYIRVVQFADQPLLGLRPCNEFRVVMYCSPVGAYFPADTGDAGDEAQRDGIRLRLVDRSRVPADSTGWAKAIANYAGGLKLKHEWAVQGYDDVLYVDARRYRAITETSGSNVFVRFDDGTVATPKLNDQILPGITRDSVITLLRDDGVTVEERDIDAAELFDRAEEMFCTGTAWAVQPVAGIDTEARSRQFTNTDSQRRLYDRLDGIKLGKDEDPHRWTSEIAGPPATGDGATP